MMGAIQWPLSNEEALLEQLEAERAISELTEIALEYWLPLAERAVLQAAAPPPDPSAAVEQDAQWHYLLDALVVYGVYLLSANAYDTAYTALTGAPLAAAEATGALLSAFDMPGMPTRETLRGRVSKVFSRRLHLSVSDIEQRIRTVPQINTWANTYTETVRPRVIDAVNRVWKRATKAIDGTPAPSVGEGGSIPAPSAESQREAVAPVFDPLDPQWQAAADQVGQTQATGALNGGSSAGAERAAVDTGRRMEVVWTAILDSHTRPAHALADGQRRALGVAFDVGGEPLRYPGDPRGDFDNTVNCRCRLFAVFVDPPPRFEEHIQAALEWAAHQNGRPYRWGEGHEHDVRTFASAEELDAFGDEDMFDDFNWVDECGGLPQYIKRIAKHLQEKGMPQSQAIATAVNSCKKMCSTGDTNWPGRQSVKKMTRAQACNAVKQWEKLKACAAKKRATKNAADSASMGALSNQNDRGAIAVGDYRSFTSVLAVIGTPTDDGRMFAQDIKLGFRDFPLPLLWQKQSAGGHYDAFTVGVIESAGVVGDEVIGKGYFLNSPEATEAQDQAAHGVTGPSVDLGDAEWELRDTNGQPVTEQDYYDNPDMELIQTVLSAKVLAATLVATPAFGQTSITLGDMVERGQDALVAAAFLVESDTVYDAYRAEMFENPQFTGPTLPHMTEDGRIQGHLAAFDVCHIGIQDACVMAPRSKTEYAWFHTAPPVTTDAGPVKVGRLTVGSGHAGPKLGVGATVAHYDNAGNCFALVHVGEDAHGIWFSGVAAPGATPEQVTAGLSAPLSGDWRMVGGNYELVAALAVNTPGFPIIASGATDEHDEPLSLIASLGPCAGSTPETPIGTDGLSADQVRAFVKIVMDEQRAEEKRRVDALALINTEVTRQASELIEGVE